MNLHFLPFAMAGSCREECRNIITRHITQMKFARQSYSVGVFDMAGLGNRYVLVEHSVYGSVARARLMDEAVDGRQIEIRLDPVRVQPRGETAAAQMGKDDVPVGV